MDFELIRSRRKTLSLEIKSDGSLLVRAPMFVPVREIKEIVEKKARWIINTQNKLTKREKPKFLSADEAKDLRKKAKANFFPRLCYLSEKFNLPFGKLTITSARTRFGSCSPMNNISLSYFLASYPQEAIDYVMLHELCHTKEHNHSQSFYRLLEKNMPDWKERKKLLASPMPEVLREE